MINIKNFFVLIALSVLFQGTALSGPLKNEFSKIHASIVGVTFKGPKSIERAAADLDRVEALIPEILLEKDHALTEAELREMLRSAREYLEAERGRIAALPARVPVTFNVPAPEPRPTAPTTAIMGGPSAATSATPSEACSHRTGASCKSRKSATATRSTLASDNIGGEEEIRATLVRLGLHNIRDAIRTGTPLSPEVMTSFLDIINKEIDALMKLLNKKKKNKPAILAARMTILRLLAALEQVGGHPDELTNFYMLLNENVELSDILDRAGNANPRTGGAKKAVPGGVNGEIHEWIRGIGVDIVSDTARRKLEEIALERGVTFVVFGLRDGRWVELYRVGNAGAEVNVYVHQVGGNFVVNAIGGEPPTIPAPAAARSTPDLDALERDLHVLSRIGRDTLTPLAERYGVTIVVFAWKDGKWHEVDRIGSGPEVHVYLTETDGTLGFIFKKDDKDPPPPPGGAAGGGGGSGGTGSVDDSSPSTRAPSSKKPRNHKGDTPQQKSGATEQMLINSVPTAAKIFVGAAAFMHKVQQRISQLRF